MRDAAIKEITRRLVDFYHPVRIYLFGSAARGDGGPDSDLDFCVSSSRMLPRTYCSAPAPAAKRSEESRSPKTSSPGAKRILNNAPPG